MSDIIKYIKPRSFSFGVADGFAYLSNKRLQKTNLVLLKADLLEVNTMLVCKEIKNNKYYIEDTLDNTIKEVDYKTMQKYNRVLDISNLPVNTYYVGYKFRLYPTKEQEVLLNKTFGCVRKLWNLMLNDRIEYYETYGEKLDNQPADYKNDYPYLKEVDSRALSAVWRNLNTAYKNFFQRKEVGFPKFKSKKHKQSYTTYNCNNSIRIEGNKIKLPKVGLVKLKITRDFDSSKIKGVTVSKTPTGKYYVSMNVETEVLGMPSNINSLGLDLGIKTFLTTSDGDKFSNNKYYDKYIRKLRKEQRKLSRKKRGSNNYNKQRLKVAKIHEKIANSRSDYLHKISTKLIKDNQFIASENLSVKNMLGNHRLAKSIQDVSWYEFTRQLEYKAKYYNRTYQQVDRFYPSSQICSNCRSKHPKIKDLSIREWTCPICNKHHDRDTNAAKNILGEGIRLHRLAVAV